MHNRMHQSAIVLVRCVPGSFYFRHHIGEDPGDEVDSAVDFRAFFGGIYHLASSSEKGPRTWACGFSRKALAAPS